MPTPFTDALRRRLLWYAALTLLLAAAGVGLGIGLPLVDSWKRMEDAMLLGAARARAQSVEAWLRHSRGVAWHVAGRTTIRLDLERLAGARSADGVAAYVEEKPEERLATHLRASLRHSGDMFGLVLLDGDGGVVAASGASLPRPCWEDIPARTAATGETIYLAGPAVVAGQECLFFAAPVLDSGERRVGTVILARKTDFLRGLMAVDPSGILGGLILELDAARGRALLRTDGDALPDAVRAALDSARAGRTGLEATPDVVYAYAPLPNGEGALALCAQTRALYAPLTDRLLRLLCWGIPFFAVCLGGFWLISRPLAGRILLHTHELEDEISARQTAQDSLLHAHQRLKEEAAQRRRLSGELISMLESVRRHLSSELHDQAGQMLTTLLLSLESARRDLHDGAGITRCAEALAHASKAVRRIQLEIRALARGLRPPTLDTLGLIPALDTLCDEYRQGGLPVHFFHGPLPPLSDDAALTLYRIAQEALTNVARHAQARQAHVTLTGREGAVSLSIEDDGQGFDAASPDAEGGRSGLGLTLMRERAVRLGGELRVDARPGQGATIMVELPCGGDDGTVPRAAGG